MLQEGRSKKRMTNNQFPLVAGGVPIIDTAKQMALYDNEDLITNIHGYYQDKDYDDVTKNYQFADQITSHQSLSTHRLQTINEGRSYAKEARQKAKKDLKKKRQAYLAKDRPYVSKQVTKKSHSIESPLPKEKPVTEMSRFTNKFHQENYILAELPREYKEPQNPSQQGSAKKNNYDFLKRSQIYNSKETREQREKTIAQELNLSRFEDLE